ncbi:hypothetical protein CDD83_6704 [Cordyceps sp. RAO-2017]|nr:hypothetical protein CDD83_6704 [Cordyceps sp. RAO-2017]
MSNEKPPPSPSPFEGRGPASGLGLRLRCRRVCSATEITSVGISAGHETSTEPSSSSPSALAGYTAPQTAQPWIDAFDVSSRRGATKMAGSHAVPAPLGGRVATMRASTTQRGQGAQHHPSGSLCIRDLGTGKTVLDLRQAVAEPVAWSRDGNVLAAGDARGSVGVWDARSGARVGMVVGHIDRVTHAAFMPGLTLVTLSRDGTARITDARTARTLSRLETDVPGARPRALAVSPDGRSVISLWGTTVHTWLPETGDLASYDLRSTRRAEGWPLCISPDCRWMACRTEDGFDLVDLASGAVAWEERRFGDADDCASMITAAAFSTDGKMLILGRMDGIVEIWDVEKREGASST